MASTTHHFRNIETILFLWTFDNKSSDGVVGVFYCRRGQVNSLYTLTSELAMQFEPERQMLLQGYLFQPLRLSILPFVPKFLFLFFNCSTLFFVSEASYQSIPYQTRTGTITFIQCAYSSDKKSLKRCSFCRRLSRVSKKSI